MPWKKSKFYSLSYGYPSMALLKFCLIMKIADAIVSVTCESIYIRNYSLDTSKEANYEANALFILNIIFGVCTIIIELSTIFVRRAILRKIDDEDVIDGEQ